MSFNFDGKIAVVTGGGSGIGAACVKGFVEAGAQVAILDRNQAGLDQVMSELDSGAEILACEVDIQDEQAVSDALDRIARKWGQVDHLVNSAASFVAAGKNASVSDWQLSLGVNVIAGARLVGRVAEIMPSGSSVVNVSSISAHVAQPERWTYNTSKAAIVELTRCQALDLAPRGIRVNVVSPGWIWTPEVSRAANGDRDLWEPVWGEFHILRRLGEPEEVSGPILFLCSATASFITGAELMVDGGYRALGPEGQGKESEFAGSN